MDIHYLSQSTKDRFMTFGIIPIKTNTYLTKIIKGRNDYACPLCVFEAENQLKKEEPQIKFLNLKDEDNDAIRAI